MHVSILAAVMPTIRSQHRQLQRHLVCELCTSNLLFNVSRQLSRKGTLFTVNISCIIDTSVRQVRLLGAKESAMAFQRGPFQQRDIVPVDIF